MPPLPVKSIDRAIVVDGERVEEGRAVPGTAGAAARAVLEVVDALLEGVAGSPFLHDVQEGGVVGVVIREAGDEDVVAVAADEPVRAGAADQEIAAAAADKQVVPVAADEDVVLPSRPSSLSFAGAAPERVSPPPAFRWSSPASPSIDTSSVTLPATVA